MSIFICSTVAKLGYVYMWKARTGAKSKAIWPRDLITSLHGGTLFDQVYVAHMTLFCMTKITHVQPVQSTRKPISYRNEWSLIVYIAHMITELESRYECHPGIKWGRTPYSNKTTTLIRGSKISWFWRSVARNIWKLYFSDFPRLIQLTSNEMGLISNI